MVIRWVAVSLIVAGVAWVPLVVEKKSAPDEKENSPAKAGAVASEKKEQAQVQNSTGPSDKHKKLSVLLGEWEGELNLVDSQTETGKVKASFKFTSLLDGYYVGFDYERAALSDGTPAVKAHGMLTFEFWDRRMYRCWWFGGNGRVLDGVAPLKKGKEGTYRFTFLSDWEGKTVERAHTFQVVSPNELRFKEETGWEGDELRTLTEGTFEKKS